MPTQYGCTDLERRQEIVSSPLNGIDYLEVLDSEALPGVARQRMLLVHCFRDITSVPAARIEGGVKVFPRASAVFLASAPEPLAGEDLSLLASRPYPQRILVVRTDAAGDFSNYRLILTEKPDHPSPPTDFDPYFSEVEFSFKVECPSEFDCRTVHVCPPVPMDAPVIDYLAKDYTSFRRLMLDRLSVILPGWTERNPADLGVALVETLAYAADHLSYQQDAVATEAYLGTAQKRVSVRRHARILDYPMNDGANARVWVAFEVDAAADGATLPAGSMLLTRTTAAGGSIEPQQFGNAINEGAQVFETMESTTLSVSRNQIAFHTWGEKKCCLPKGATKATLQGNGTLLLEVGQLLVFEEIAGPATGNPADADLAHRHVVRLTGATETTDPLSGTPVVEIAWDNEDALPFPLCLTEPPRDAQSRLISVARGNVALADFGRTIHNETLQAPPASGRYRPMLRFGPLTQTGMMRARQSGKLVSFDDTRPAASALVWDLRDVRPAVMLTEGGRPDQAWTPQRDLMNSDRFARDFVVEADDTGRAVLRFGDDDQGRRPPGGSSFAATYRVGNGPAGNVGADAIANIVTTQAGITKVWNPLPARGGTAPEPKEHVRLYAPQAFRTQERAVTEADYAAAAQRHPDVQRAAARFRWTGSWYTVFISIDRRGGRPVDPPFQTEVRNFLERFRLAGYDLEVERPIFAALHIVLTVCVAPGYIRSGVKAALLETFGNVDLADGRRGFFHPDNFSFGQPVYLSQIVAAAMRVPGVQWVDTSDQTPNHFQRWGDPRSVSPTGRLLFERLEIPQLDNDPNAPENGKIEFLMRGGQ